MGQPPTRRFRVRFMTKITEQTAISVSLLGIIIGCAMWMTTIYNTAEANRYHLELMIRSKELEATTLKREISRLNSALESINTRLSRIEGSLNKNP